MRRYGVGRENTASGPQGVRMGNPRLMVAWMLLMLTDCSGVKPSDDRRKEVSKGGMADVREEKQLDACESGRGNWKPKWVQQRQFVSPRFSPSAHLSFSQQSAAGRSGVSIRLGRRETSTRSSQDISSFIPPNESSGEERSFSSTWLKQVISPQAN